MTEPRKSPPTPTQLSALATFAATGMMTTDNRVINALMRRELVARTDCVSSRSVRIVETPADGEDTQLMPRVTL